MFVHPVFATALIATPATGQFTSALLEKLKLGIYTTRITIPVLCFLFLSLGGYQSST
jgi:hypothetical protein